MAVQKNNEAYDFSLFEEHEGKVVRMPRPEKKEKEHRLTALEGYLRALIVLVVVALGFSMFGLMVYSKMELSQINDELIDTQTQLSIAQSEHTRLQAELEESMTTRNIDQYAQRLGMRRVQPYQIEYYMLHDNDRVEMLANTEQKGLWASVVDFLTGWLS